MTFGRALLELGRRAEADEALRDAAELYREGGNTQGLAHALETRGTLLRELGRRDEADAALRQSIELYRKVGDAEGEQRALAQLAGTP